MIWRGIAAKSSPLDDTPGVSEFQQNTRMRVKGELQRRWGMLSTNIAKQAGPIYGIMGANPAGGNFLTFDVFSAGSPSTGIITGFGPPPLPPWKPPKKKKPDADVCAIYAKISSGAADDTVTYIFPANCCAGSVSMTAIEAGGGGRGDPYGYTFNVDINGVNVYTSACLQDDSAMFAIPANSQNISVNISGGCAGAGDVGTWIVSISG